MTRKSKSEYTALGKRVTEFTKLDTFPCPEHVTVVTMESDEVTAVCPVTGQPDQYTVTIYYCPGELCIESKTLKLLLQSYRNVGMFCEALASDILRVVCDAVKPIYCRVEILQKPRGGVSIRAVASM